MSNGVPIGAPFGLQLPVNDCRVSNRTGGNLTKGAIMRLAFEDFTESEATDNNPGHVLSGLANGIAAVAAGMSGMQICVVLLEDIADDASGMCRVYGRVEAQGGSAVDISSAGPALTVGTAQLGGHATDGQGIYAIALADAPSDGSLVEVLWNGFSWGTAGS